VLVVSPLLFDSRVQVCLLNFTITPEGLSDQLLALVVAKERPELEEERAELVLQTAKYRRDLKQLEDKILALLSDARGRILDDEELITTLSAANATSVETEKRVNTAEEMERKIEVTRQKYAPMAQRGAVLFFAVADLSNLDPMYQHSLQWFFNVYTRTIISAAKHDDVAERVRVLVDEVTYNTYIAVCRAIFARHKLLLSFLLALRILGASNELNQGELRFLLTGGTGSNVPSRPNPCTEWLSDKAWDELNRMTQQAGPAFDGFLESFEQNLSEWRAYGDEVRSDAVLLLCPCL